jgi:hypothetical protein
MQQNTIHSSSFVHYHTQLLPHYTDYTDDLDTNNVLCGDCRPDGIGVACPVGRP